MSAPRQWGPTTAGAVATLLAVVTATVALMAGPAPAATQEERCYIARNHEIFLARPATSTELATWSQRFDTGTPHHRLPQELAASDEWLSVEVAKIYRQALDRDPDAEGLAFWIDQLRRGALVNRIASLVYGSGEFHTRSGGTEEGFVTALYRRVLHREPDAAGVDYWRSQLETRNRARVAERFFASRESRVDRITALYRDILGRAPDQAGLEHWIVVLETSNDVRLAVLLASSGELFARAQQGCTVPPPPATVVISGHGFGHGRGMGQWGALGYAVDHSWSSAQIVDHFYGGTVGGSSAGIATPRVFLTASEGQDLVVTQTAAVLRVDGLDADLGAVRVARLGPGQLRVWQGTGCDGPWTLVGDRAATEVRVQSRLVAGDDATRLLQHCTASGTRYYRGDLLAVDGRNTLVTVNEVDIESMLRSVVAREMSPSWVDLGAGRGAQAVQAQAVAARSFVLSTDARWTTGGRTWASTCDSSAQCLSYPGYGTRLAGQSTITRIEDARTDAAVAATAGQVRRTGSTTGPVARTEFSASSGGWSAGGTFPAVVDEGDAHAANPYHSWTVTLTRDAVEAAFDAREGRDLGAFVGFDSYVRDGRGDLGGRVLSVRARFSGGDVTLTGDQLRFLLGLRSTWFTAT